MNTYIKVALGCFLLFTACKKESPAPYVPRIIPYHKLSVNTVNFFTIPMGKYFIYKDSASGNIDSVSVIHSLLSENVYTNKEIIPCSGICGIGVLNYYYDSYSLTLKNHSTGSSWLQGTAESFFDTIVVFRDTIQGTKHTWHPLYTLSSSQEYSFKGTMHIEGKLYSNVHCFTSMNGYLPLNPNHKTNIIYWVQGLGVIQRTMITGTIRTTEYLVRNG